MSSEVKVVYHSMGNINKPNDFTYPFRMVGVLGAPSFMEVAAVFISRNEEFIIIGMTKQALEEASVQFGIKNNSRLISLVIEPNIP